MKHRITYIGIIAALWTAAASMVAAPIRIVKPNFGSVEAVDGKGNRYPASDTSYDIAQGTELTFFYTPKNECSVFAEWQCVGGAIDANDRLVVGTDEVIVYTRFQIIQYTIEAQVMPAEAGRARVRCGVGDIFLDVAGAVNCGSTVQLIAVEDANSGFKFVGWDDGVTERIRLVPADEDRTYIAFFSNPSSPTGIEDTEINHDTEQGTKSNIGQETTKFIENNMLKIRHNGLIYNAQGQPLK